MALFPCDWCKKVAPGRNVNVYIGRVDGIQADRYSMRLCRGHWDRIEDNLAQYEVVIEDGAVSSFDTVTECVACTEPINESWVQLFVTSYPTKNERKDYWARIHRECPTPRLLTKPE